MLVVRSPSRRGRRVLRLGVQELQVIGTSRYPKAGQEVHKRPPGSVMTVEFELDGQPFTALNGGPVFKFNEAISLQVLARTRRRSTTTGRSSAQGGDPKAQQCGWLKDKFGLSWQVVPAVCRDVQGPRAPESARAMEAMLEMKKIDIAELERAAAGDKVTA